MELKIEHIKSYPFDVKYKILDYKCDYVGNKYDNIKSLYYINTDKEKLWHIETVGGAKPCINRIKPILRPLSDVEEYFRNIWESTQELPDYISEEYLMQFFLDINEIENRGTNYLPVGLYNLLLKHHFDVFNLIEKKLAIDINTIKK